MRSGLKAHDDDQDDQDGNERDSGEKEKEKEKSWSWMGEIPADDERLDGQDHLGQGSRSGAAGAIAGSRHRH